MASEGLQLSRACCLQLDFRGELGFGVSARACDQSSRRPLHPAPSSLPAWCLVWTDEWFYFHFTFSFKPDPFYKSNGFLWGTCGLKNIRFFLFSVCFINHFTSQTFTIVLLFQDVCISQGCGGTMGHPLDLWLGRGHKWTLLLGSLTALPPSRLPVVGTGGAGRGGSLRPGRMETLEGKFCDALPGFCWCIFCCCLFLRFFFYVDHV